VNLKEAEEILKFDSNKQLYEAIKTKLLSEVVAVQIHPNVSERIEIHLSLKEKD
tara:strand:- start:972 stop:1133 length:162 start_codon:yes stop_codon:yes gene_type:complete